jgi:hypothetical protein
VGVLRRRNARWECGILFQGDDQALLRCGPILYYADYRMNCRNKKSQISEKGDLRACLT